MRTEYWLIALVAVLWKCKTIKWQIAIVLIIALSMCVMYGNQHEGLSDRTDIPGEGLDRATMIGNVMRKRKLKVDGEGIEKLKRKVYTLEHKLHEYQHAYNKLTKKYKALVKKNR